MPGELIGLVVLTGVMLYPIGREKLTQSYPNIAVEAVNIPTGPGRCRSRQAHRHRPVLHRHRSFPLPLRLDYLPQRLSSSIMAHRVQQNQCRAPRKSMAVAESARGRGIGAALIRRIEQTLADRGCTVLISNVWQDALGFYQALGWSAPPVVLLRHRLPPLAGAAEAAES